MDVVILAAGFGSRLASLGEPKPLVPIMGVPLVELSIMQAAAAGFTRFVVVTGHRSADVERALLSIANRTGLTIEACTVDDWSRPNGHSVLAGSSRTAGNYLLLMADHVFAPAILEVLAAQMSLAAGTLLAIDRNIAGPTIDADDATYVKLDAARRIVSIGKGLSNPDAVDCGAFVATPDLAAGIRKAIASGAAGSLSDGMQWLADRGLASALDVTGHWWIDVDDPHMHSVAQAGVQVHLPAMFTAKGLAPTA
jgi:1L-myo-inositol 1-phosphate cytidylyltransferase